MGVLLAALLGGLLFFNTASPRKAEKMAEKVLRDRFPSATVDVGIRGKRGTDTLNGHFREVNVDMSQFTVAPPAATSAIPNAGAATGANAATGASVTTTGNSAAAGGASTTGFAGLKLRAVPEA